jgi:Uma2 family endonuclease
MTGFSEDPAPFAARLGKAAFFTWVQAQEGGRFELKDGHIVMHAGSTTSHWVISSRFVAAFSSRLDLNRWVCGMADLAIEIGEDVRYPDVAVHAFAELMGPRSTDKPSLVVEVLSPSSVSRDMHLKLAEYTSLPSLQCYIVASQDEAIVWVWQRDEDTGAFPALPEEICGLEAAIAVRALAITLPFGEIYRGLFGGKAP